MLIGIVTFLLVVIALLAIPVSVSFQINWPQTDQGKIELRWLFGLVRVRFNPFESTAPSFKGETLVGKISELEESSDKNQNGLSMFRQQAFRRRIFRFLRDIWQVIKKQDIKLYLRIGLGDPADTGQLWAIVGPVAGILANVQQVSIAIEPDFFDTTIELDSSGTIRLIPLQLIAIILGLLLSPTVWQGIKQKHTLVA